MEKLLLCRKYETLFGLLYKEKMVTGTPCYMSLPNKLDKKEKKTHKNITMGFMSGLVLCDKASWCRGNWKKLPSNKQPAFFFTVNINLVMFWRMEYTASPHQLFLYTSVIFVLANPLNYVQTTTGRLGLNACLSKHNPNSKKSRCVKCK